MHYLFCTRPDSESSILLQISSCSCFTGACGEWVLAPRRYGACYCAVGNCMAIILHKRPNGRVPPWTCSILSPNTLRLRVMFVWLSTVLCFAERYCSLHGDCSFLLVCFCLELVQPIRPKSHALQLFGYSWCSQQVRLPDIGWFRVKGHILEAVREENHALG